MAKIETGQGSTPVTTTASGLFCPTCNLVCTSQVSHHVLVLCILRDNNLFKVVYDDHMKGKNHASKVAIRLIDA